MKYDGTDPVDGNDPRWIDIEWRLSRKKYLDARYEKEQKHQKGLDTQKPEMVKCAPSIHVQPDVQYYTDPFTKTKIVLKGSRAERQDAIDRFNDNHPMEEYRGSKFQGHNW